MVNWVKLAVARGEAKPSIPEYALDMHTAQGQAKGRGLRHFYETGARLEPELPNRDLTYRQRIMEMLADKPRMSLTMISKKTGIPISTVYERIKQIEERYEFKGIFTRRCKG